LFTLNNTFIFSIISTASPSPSPNSMVVSPMFVLLTASIYCFYKTIWRFVEFKKILGFFLSYFLLVLLYFLFVLFSILFSFHFSFFFFLFYFWLYFIFLYYIFGFYSILDLDFFILFFVLYSIFYSKGKI